ncbi:hypothetical protein O1Q79_00980 [Lonepinella sp. MS14434]|uniref:glycosyltransferase n=1 Tax=Lonepinella sp. MS14434 TaxID=3003617 RepID=UPI0036DEF3F3
MITTCIVLYKNDKNELLKAINSLLNSKLNEAFTLYLIDNSPTDELKDIVQSENVVYISNPTNPGFGAAHNIAIQKSIESNAKYHFVVNPDVYFKPHVMQTMIDYMNANKFVGMMMPQILNSDGSIQNLPKLLPSPYSVLMRKLKKPKFIYDKFIERYELRNIDKTMIYNAPILSGCFTLFRIDALKEIGFYDDRFFMYFEDWDLSRRVHQKYKTIYFPKVSVHHGYESGANKSKRLFKIFVNSAKVYFNKWGWIFDKERVLINRKTLEQFK